MKKDLNILKTLEFPSIQSEDDARPLEVLILERSKALQVTISHSYVFSGLCSLFSMSSPLQAENSMLRLDKERLVREVNTAKVPPPTH